MLPVELRRRLEEGEFVSDIAFDAHLPEHLRRVSHRFWTPLEVAQRVCRWLSLSGARRVLDVGSGAGKFCVAGAMTSDLTFIGVERRAHLVVAAAELAGRFGLEERALFLNGEPDAELMRAVDAIYFFNPFEENLFLQGEWLDDTVDLSSRRFMREVEVIEEMLADVAAGTRVVTYNSFGGRICGTYDLAQKCSMHGNPLRMWVKSDRARDGRWWHELLGDEILDAPR